MAGRAQAFSDDTVIALTSAALHPGGRELLAPAAPGGRQGGLLPPGGGAGTLRRTRLPHEHAAGVLRLHRGRHRAGAAQLARPAADDRAAADGAAALERAHRRRRAGAGGPGAGRLRAGQSRPLPRGRAGAAPGGARPAPRGGHAQGRLAQAGLEHGLRLVHGGRRRPRWCRRRWSGGAAGRRRPAVLRRLARFHLRDFVRGEPVVWPEEALREGHAGGGGGRRRPGSGPGCASRGAVRLEWEARWVRPEDRGGAQPRTTGIDATLLRGGGVGRRGRTLHRASTCWPPAPAGGRTSTTTARTTSGRRRWGSPSSWPGSSPRDRTPPHTIYHREYFGDGGGARGERPVGAERRPGSRPLIPQAHRLILVRHAHSQVDPRAGAPHLGVDRNGGGGTRRAWRRWPSSITPPGYYAGAEPKMEQTLAPVAARARDDGAAGGRPGRDGEQGLAGGRGAVQGGGAALLRPPAGAPGAGLGDAGRGDGALQGRASSASCRGTPWSSTPDTPCRGRWPSPPGDGCSAPTWRDALGLDAAQAFAVWSALRMPDLAVLELAPGRAARLVVPFGTIALLSAPR